MSASNGTFDEAIEEVIAHRLIAVHGTLAVAESCTGGMVGEVITSISGASGFFLGGIIAYGNSVKAGLLGVDERTLEREGAVSENVALQMAAGVRRSLGADYGIGVTGIAGPAGGTPEKPVGLVYVSISSDTGEAVRGDNFDGGRDEVRRASVNAALHLLLEKLDSDQA